MIEGMAEAGEDASNAPMEKRHMESHTPALRIEKLNFPPTGTNALNRLKRMGQHEVENTDHLKLSPLTRTAFYRFRRGFDTTKLYYFYRCGFLVVAITSSAAR